VTEQTYAPPRRSFSPRTTQDIRLGKVSVAKLIAMYDLDRIEVRLLTQAEKVDQFGRIAE